MMCYNEIILKKCKSIGFVFEKKCEQSVGISSYVYNYEKGDIIHTLSILETDDGFKYSLYSFDFSNIAPAIEGHIFNCPLNTGRNRRMMDDLFNELFTEELRDNNLNTILE